MVYSKGGMMTFPAANAIYRRETYDNYPAARAILQVVYEGLLLPFDRALTVESRHFAKILRSPEAAAMIRSLFVSMQELNKGARRPASVPPTQFKKIGILGAGFMGAGIASVSAQAGLAVVLIDRDQDSAEKGKAHIHKSLTDQFNRGRMKSADRDAVLARVAATADYQALAGCDLVVEAVFEDRKVKAEATAKAQAVVPEIVFGSNTSTLPISSLADGAKDPAKFIGIHFFSPVERMMLVEVILGKRTGDAALAAALDFVRAIRKTPIVVNDARGFYTSRVVGTYLQQLKPTSAPRPSTRGKRSSWRIWWRSAAASVARTARAFTTIRKAGPSDCGRGSPTCSRRSSIPTRSTSPNSSTAC
jgi:3-hydroxyacyl-CoA dehydrogenase/enoyl-CoA hydratase/3-hydroxybutyryl-CoA epimerase